MSANQFYYVQIEPKNTGEYYRIDRFLNYRALLNFKIEDLVEYYDMFLEVSCPLQVMKIINNLHSIINQARQACS